MDFCYYGNIFIISEFILICIYHKLGMHKFEKRAMHLICPTFCLFIAPIKR